MTNATNATESPSLLLNLSQTQLSALTCSLVLTLLVLFIVHATCFWVGKFCTCRCCCSCKKEDSSDSLDTLQKPLQSKTFEVPA